MQDRTLERKIKVALHNIGLHTKEADWQSALWEAEDVINLLEKLARDKEEEVLNAQCG
jgi:hypothetical protein